MDRNNLKSNGARDRLISLINEKKSGFHEGTAAVVRCEFALIAEARKNGASWKEIADAIGFPGKENGFGVAFFRERRRRAKKEKEVVPEKKKEVMLDAKAKTQKESTFFRSEDKPKGGRIGSPKPIGRGRLDLGEDTPDDEL